MNRRIGGPAFLVFTAAVVIAANAFAGGPKAVTFLAAVSAAGGALWSAIQRAESEQALRKKSEEIASLSHRIAATVTGGDSWGYLTLSAGQGLLTVVHEGHFPLYDVTADVADLDKSDKLGTA